MVWCPPDSCSRIDRSLCQTSARLTQVLHITEHDLGPLFSFFSQVPPESESYLSPCWLSWKYELWFRPRTFFCIDKLAFPRVFHVNHVSSSWAIHSSQLQSNYCHFSAWRWWSLSFICVCLSSLIWVYTGWIFLTNFDLIICHALRYSHINNCSVIVHGQNPVMLLGINVIKLLARGRKISQHKIRYRFEWSTQHICVPNSKT